MHSAVAGLNPDKLEVAPFLSGRQFLLAELDWLRLVLQRQVLRLRARGLMVENDFRGLFLSEEHIDAILENRGPDYTDATSLDSLVFAQRELIADQLQHTFELGITLPMEHLTETFRLNGFERKVLVACMAPEIDLGFEDLYAYVQNDVNRKRPTADLLLRLFSPTQLDRIGHRASLSPDGALLRNSLVSFSADSQTRAQYTLARSLATEEHIVDFLLDATTIDSRLQPFTSLHTPRTSLDDLLLPEPLTRLLSNAVLSDRAPRLILLNGPAGCGKRVAFEALSNAMQRRVLVADLRKAAAQTLPLEEYVPLLRRDAALHRANLFLSHSEALEPERRERLLHLLEPSLLEPSADVPSLVTTFIGSTPQDSSRSTAYHPSCLSFTLPAPSFATRIDLWNRAIAATRLPALEVDVVALSSRFVLTGGQIAAACNSAAHQASLSEQFSPALDTGRLSECARSQSNQALTKLAHKIESIYNWNDLVLPRRALQQLREVVSSYKYRHVVYSEWGFDRRLAMGKGLIILFSGPSGTGKTMAAGILGVELGLDIYKIDLSTVISKYIGETEKQLELIFHEAHSSNAILFFDEADALFGKRSEVKDAHDRYANVETSYLLQKIEEYEGVVVLTTNFRKNIDEAFARRMHHVVEFPFPEAAQRLLIWKGLLPENGHLHPDVDFGFLARQFELAGGSIRNVALAAAFLAAEDHSQIRMEHLILAAAREMLKLGKFPSRSEFREHFDVIHSQL